MPTFHQILADIEDPTEVIAGRVKIVGREKAGVLRRPHLYVGQQVRAEVRLSLPGGEPAEGASLTLTLVRPDRTRLEVGAMEENEPGIYSAISHPDMRGEWIAVVQFPDPLPSDPFYVSANPLPPE